ncbi:alpha/beta fold hydrolase [Herbaspirillum rubrisubalbicans]|uniref:alpha/beta fold hydrolase n=1 Tax=Herbaspirillum rubrisubalbicans TaxID=80842 RepID=UPI0009E9C404|nr:alpha/beta fold hydrolase [Herbaspirillum rubrisubalbicans]
MCDGADWPGDFAALARLHVDCLRSMQPQGPYHLLGWSLGGLLALEIASQLESRGQSVAWVGAVDAKSPQQRALDRLGKNRELVRRTQPSAQEMERFWTSQAERDDGAAQFLADVQPQSRVAAQDQQRLAENLARAPNYVMALTSAGLERRIRADLHVWWSAQTPPQQRQGWEDSSTGTMSVNHIAQVSHREIVKSPQLVDAIQALLPTVSPAGEGT